MTAVLVTGMSGVGKSSVADELKRRGFRAVDTDAEASRVAPDGEWLWEEEMIKAHLDAMPVDSVLFIVGSASNQVSFYGSFDFIVLLTAPIEVMIRRIRMRTSNPFGKTEQEREKVVADKERFEPMMRRRAHAEVGTDQPLSDVVERILALVET